MFYTLFPKVMNNMPDWLARPFKMGQDRLESPFHCPPRRGSKHILTPVGGSTILTISWKVYPPLTLTMTFLPYTHVQNATNRKRWWHRRHNCKQPNNEIPPSSSRFSIAFGLRADGVPQGVMDKPLHICKDFFFLPLVFLKVVHCQSRFLLCCVYLYDTKVKMLGPGPPILGVNIIRNLHTSEKRLSEAW